MHQYKRDERTPAQVAGSCLGLFLVLIVFSFIAATGLFAGGWLAWRIWMVGF